MTFLFFICDINTDLKSRTNICNTFLPSNTKKIKEENWKNLNNSRIERNKNIKV